jgi:piezo-type mechanosensitive ion channel component 1/2
VYAIGKLLRSALIPLTDAIIIEDAHSPDDLLMLCDTIVLYRLKGNLIEEEQLYFLLIDILRSPQVLKAIAKDSIRTYVGQIKQRREEEESTLKEMEMRRTRYSQI